MRYVFFGNAEFSCGVLKKLIEADFVPGAVICSPDKPVGRKRAITPPLVKVLVQGYGVTVFQPPKLKIEDWEGGKNDWDLFIVASYPQIISKDILAIPRLGTIGVHPSLLPKYRGPSPIQTAILNGEKETGVTLFLLDERLDHGPIVSSVRHQVSSNDWYEGLMIKLAGLGGDLLVEVLPKFYEGRIKPVPQDEGQATYTKKFATEDGYIDLEKDNPALVERKIRALNPEPGVWTMKDGKRMKILEAELTDGKLKLKKIQFAGKKPM